MRPPLPYVLRRAEPSDASFLYQAENSFTPFLCSTLVEPVSLFEAGQMTHLGTSMLAETGQLLLILSPSPSPKELIGAPLGYVIFYGYQPIHQRAGLGLYILPDMRRQGLALEMLHLAAQFAVQKLSLALLYAEVVENNIPALGLFEKAGYTRSAVLPNWVKVAHKTYSQVIFTLCLP